MREVGGASIYSAGPARQALSRLTPQGSYSHHHAPHTLYSSVLIESEACYLCVKSGFARKGRNLHNFYGPSALLHISRLGCECVSSSKSL